MNLVVIPSKKRKVVTVTVFKAMKNYRPGDETPHILNLGDLKVSVSCAFWLISTGKNAWNILIIITLFVHLK